MVALELYRKSTVGDFLMKTLEEMVDVDRSLSPELANKVLLQFDKSITEALESQVKTKTKISIEGRLHTYRSYDNVATFIIQNASFKSGPCQEYVGRLKIVACNTKFLLCKGTKK